MSNTQVKQVFENLFTSIDKEIAFDPTLEDEDGYFDRAVRAVKLARGQLARTTAACGRRLVFIGTSVGTCVVFDRYAEDPNGFIVACLPTLIKNVLRISGPLSTDQLIKLQACM